jgi:hypothetical protein
MYHDDLSAAFYSSANVASGLIYAPSTLGRLTSGTVLMCVPRRLARRREVSIILHHKLEPLAYFVALHCILSNVQKRTQQQSTFNVC